MCCILDARNVRNIARRIQKNLKSCVSAPPPRRIVIAFMDAVLLVL